MKQLILLFSLSISLFGAVPTDYSNCKVVTTQAAMVSGSSDLTNFPLLIRVSDVNLRTKANGGLVNNTSGFDIGFGPDCSYTGAMLTWDLYYYDAASGRISARVLRPTLSHTVDNTVGMYFGSAAVTYQSTASSVYVTSQRAVWHMLPSIGIGDSTTNALNLVNVGAGNYVGKIDGAVNFGSGNALTQASTTLLQSEFNAPLTVEGWFYFTRTATSETLVGNVNAPSTFQGWELSTDVGGVIFFLVNNFGVHAAYKATNSLQVPLNTWTHIAATYSGNGLASGIKLYVNSVEYTNTTVGEDNLGGFTTVNGLNTILGKRRDNTQPFVGQMDEISVVNAAVSADWLATQYRNDLNNKYQNFGPIVLQTTSGLTASATAAVGYSPDSIRLTWTTSATANSRVFCGTSAGGPYPYWTQVSDIVKTGNAYYGTTSHALSVMVPNNTSSTAYKCIGESYDTSANVVRTPEVTAGTLTALTSVPITVASISPSPIYYNCQTGTLGCVNANAGWDGDTFYYTWAADDNIYAATNDGAQKWLGGAWSTYQAVGAWKFTKGTLNSIGTVLGNTSGANSFGSSAGAVNIPSNYGVADGQRPYGEGIVSVDGSIIYDLARCCVAPYGPTALQKTRDGFDNVIGPQNNTGPSATGVVFNTSRLCPATGTTIAGCWDYPDSLATTTTPTLFPTSLVLTPWYAQFGRDWGGANDVYIDSTWKHNAGTDSNVYAVNEFGLYVISVDRHNFQITNEQWLYRGYVGDGGATAGTSNTDGLLPWTWMEMDGVNGTIIDSNTRGARPKMYWLPEPLNRWVYLAQTWSGSTANSDQPISISIFDVGQFPWNVQSATLIGSLPKDTSNTGSSNYDQLYTGFASLRMDMWLNAGNGCGAVPVSFTGSYLGPSAPGNPPAADRYSPTYRWVTFCPGTAKDPQYVGGGKKKYPAKGLDVLYTFDHPSFATTLKNRAGFTKYDTTVAQAGYTSAGLLVGVPQSTNFNSPYNNTFTTAYTADLTDFTLIASFMHNPNIGVNNGETVLDKTKVKVFRSGSSANTCVVTVGVTTSSPFACTMDGSWFTVVVTVSGTTVTVYGSAGIGNTLPLTSLTTFTAAGYTSTGTTAMIVGNNSGAIGGWRGQIGEIGFYNRALPPSELITLVAANRARFAAQLPAVVIP
jgi:hypothetical protein